MAEARAFIRWIPAAAGLAAFGAYAAGAAREVTGEDAGHLATAAFELGIPHPPGYPLWCLLAHAATWLPIGSPCFRVALFSSLCGALAASLVASTVLRLGGGGLAAAAAALALASSRTIGSQAVVAEVYTMNAVLLAAAILLFLRWRERPSPGRLAALAFVGGLALVHHPTMQVLVPLGFVPAVLLSRPFPLRRGRALAVALGAGVAGLLPLLYLPIRSAANPYLDWGNPETLENFWRVLRRRQYGAESPDLASLFDADSLVERFSRYARNWGGEWPVPGAAAAGAVFVLAMAAWGLVRLWKRDRKTASLLALLSLLGGPLVVFLLGLDVAGTDPGNLSVYAHAALVPLAALFGVGVGGLPPIARTLGVLVPLASGAVHARALAKTDDPWVADWARNVLAGAEEKAAIFAYDDDEIFPLGYVQRVEGARPDVLLLGNVANGAHRELLSRMDAATAERCRRAPRPAQRRIQETFLLGRLPGRPVCFTEPREFDDLPGTRVVSRGLLWRLVRAGEAEPPPAPWSRYRWRFADDARPPDAAAAGVLSSLALARGCDALERGKRDQALAAFARIPEGGRRTLSFWMNAGSALGRAGAYAEAAGFFDRVLRADPRSRDAGVNLGLAHLASGRPGEAIVPLRGALAADPHDLEAGLALVEAQRLSGDEPGALETARGLVARAPGDPRPLLLAAEILYRTQGDAAGARSLLDRAAALGPLPPAAARLRESLDRR
ncbi:MAG TPA: DUF2723 domain-containing protein [Planctomycetota bacterium]|nr:DUF2723 domain-containing protein [Planctomycetota bacterium]